MEVLSGEECVLQENLCRGSTLTITSHSPLSLPYSTLPPSCPSRQGSLSKLSTFNLTTTISFLPPGFFETGKKLIRCLRKV